MSDKINILDEITANQIAAGEVVERPMSVVKELCENALDAGADSVKIEIENGGQTLIRVTDNGCGMSERDALMSLSRHATSKIKTAADLADIHTLGFRGEAVPSIASVSRLVIETCDNNEGSGIRITVTGGEPESVEDIAFSKGTRITVRELFYNVPARRKFMKSVNTEQAQVAGLVSQLAVSNPNVRFELVNLVPSKKEKGTLTGNRLLLSSGGGNLLNAVTSVLGADTARNMTQFSEKDEVCSVSGYISVPSACKSSRRDEYLFVNGRSVKNRNILYMAELPFKTLAPGKYPTVVMFVDIAPDLVDVNVHPTKSEVNFSNESLVKSLVYKAVMKAVTGGAAPIDISQNTEKSQNTSGAPQNLSSEANIADYCRGKTSVDKSINDESLIFDVLKEKREDPFDWNTEEYRISEEELDLKVIGQYRNAYIVCSGRSGIVIVDQHVAHERVLFEGFMNHTGDNTWSQLLLVPENISCSVKETVIVNARMEELNKAGFLLEEFGTGCYIVRGYPACLKEHQAKQVLEEIIHELGSLQGDKKLAVKPERVLTTASCRMAVKAGDKLTVEEMQTLMDDLQKCSIKNTCPHGRPIILSLTDYELDKAFQRI